VFLSPLKTHSAPYGLHGGSFGIDGLIRSDDVSHNRGANDHIEKKHILLPPSTFPIPIGLDPNILGFLGYYRGKTRNGIAPKTVIVSAWRFYLRAIGRQEYISVFQVP